MLRTICRKRLQLLVLTLIMSAFLIFTTSFAFGDSTTVSSTTESLTTVSSTTESSTTVSSTTIYSTSALIKAKYGGYLSLSKTMGLTVPKYALSNDTVLTASFVYDKSADTFEFVFGPSPLSFRTQLQLFVSWHDLENFGLLHDPILYYEGTPVAYSKSYWGMTYYLDHFSIYYFGRR
jgi:hypothetical protein